MTKGPFVVSNFALNVSGALAVSFAGFIRISGAAIAAAPTTIAAAVATVVFGLSHLIMRFSSVTGRACYAARRGAASERVCLPLFRTYISLHGPGPPVPGLAGPGRTGVAQLDTMLRALAERGARELLFKEDAQPTFRYPDGDKPVSPAALSRAQIVTLIAELAGAQEGGALRAGAATRFVYKLSDGRSFAIEAGAAG